MPEAPSMTNVVKVVTDSTCDLPESVLNEIDVIAVPQTVIDGNDILKDRVDIFPKQVFENMKKGKFYKTTQVSPQDFVEVIEPLVEQNEQVLLITLAKKLSGTYQSALLAKDFLDAENLWVYDANTTSAALGLVILYAAELAKQGKSAIEIIKELDRIREDIRLYAYVEDLEYLRRGGRIGKAQAWIGTLLRVKPILSLIDAVVTPITKARGIQKAQEEVVAQFVSYYEPRGLREKNMWAVVLHANEEESAKTVLQLLKENFNIEYSVVSILGATIGVHVGPGSVLCALLPRE